MHLIPYKSRIEALRTSSEGLRPLMRRRIGPVIVSLQLLNSDEFGAHIAGQPAEQATLDRFALFVSTQRFLRNMSANSNPVMGEIFAERRKEDLQGWSLSEQLDAIEQMADEERIRAEPR